MPLFPFENPWHALVLVGLGGLFWMFGTVARSIPKNKDMIRETIRYTPWFMLWHGRQMTKEEANGRLPPLFFHVYGVLGFLAQWVGLAVLTAGLLGLVTSITMKLNR